MCGIVGVVSSAPVAPDAVRAMRDTLAHRGPDSRGLWQSADARVCLGHQRLSVIDTMPRSDQPLHSTDGQFTAVLNGEIYNYRELRRELGPLGARFATSSDTEVLIEAFRYWGAACLAHLSGMFAFAIWDAHAQRLFCARDRAGEKPLYWARVGNALLFGSEVKALLRWPHMHAEIDHHALAEYLHFGFVPDPGCIWQGVEKLAPGHSLGCSLSGDGTLHLGSPVRWWDMTFEPDDSVSDWGPEIRDTLSRATREMTVSDVPLGTFLSGGVDSSAVTAALSREAPDVTAFTIGFDDDPDCERPWARQVARQYGVRHRERLLSPADVAAPFDALLWNFDEPFSDASFLPTYLVCREARGEITVALSGDGADELFGGYRRYRYLGARQFRHGWVSPRMARWASFAARAALPEGLSLRRNIARFAADRCTMLTDLLSVGHDSRTVRAAARGPLAAALADYSPYDTVARLLRNIPPEVGLVDSMRYLDLKLTLASGMLVKVDRASMAVALEVRAVFLHREMLALVGRIPAAQLVKHGEPKHVLKLALRPWLPDSLLFRRKRGFSAPGGQWMRGAPGERAVVPGPLDELLDPALLAALRARHAEGHGDRSQTIQNLDVLERWFRRWTGPGALRGPAVPATIPVPASAPILS